MAEFNQGCMLTKLRVGFRMLFPSTAEVRAVYPSAAKTFGLAGAYFTRIYDLLKRRTVDLLPWSKRYKQLKKPLAEMSQRQNLNRKLLQLDS
jgi:hypothetical protein